MLPIQLTVGPLATADADGVATSQTPLAAGAMTLDGALVSGGVATMDVPRRVIVTSAGNDSNKTFRITGTNSDNNPIRETITGGNIAAVATVQDFKTVTEIYASAATAAAVIAGTNGVASSPWKLTNWMHQAVSQITWDCVVSGTVTYGIEWSPSVINDNQNSMGGALGNYPSTPVARTLTTLTAKTADASASQDNPIQAWRAVITAGTGSVTVRALEGGISEAS